ncbi:MAG: F0F1 ATP synthase subunit A [Bryobacteraceae bacterium]|nr:F0F1 ATP synthase subunit A [Bryobacteraceae bacterium]
MHETEHVLWFTALLNQYFAGPAEAVLKLAGLKYEPGRPWANFMAMEILVILLLMIAAAVLRTRLSVDKPGTFQLTIEAVHDFLAEQARDIIGHGYQKYVAWFCTLFIFILISNLLGVIPTFESPTMYYYVPAGLALCTFLYYNGMGIKTHGLLGYLKELAGPMWWLAWFMFPLELISHFIRPVSLTIRLYANMLAGEKVTLGFLALLPFVVPVAVMALHVFVSLLQAFIFTVLAIAYVGSAVAEEE